MNKTLQTSRVIKRKRQFISALLFLHKFNSLLSERLWIQIPSEEKNSMFSPKRPLPLPSHPKKKMTGTFQPCERGRLGDRLAGYSARPPIRICESDGFTQRSSCCFPTRPTSHLLRTYSWQKLVRKWFTVFARDAPTCWVKSWLGMKSLYCYDLVIHGALLKIVHMLFLVPLHAALQPTSTQPPPLHALFKASSIVHMLAEFK